MIAATHAEAIAAIPGARLVAVTDVVPERAIEFAGSRGCAAEPSLDALLARDDIDVVSVCVPSGLHAEVGIQAAAAGKHLVVEKPIDVSLAAADRLIAAVDAAGVAMTVISQHRFDPGLVELRGLIDDGVLGRLVLGEASTKWYRSQGYYDSGPWRGTWALDGGSLMNQGIHYVDLLRWSHGPGHRGERRLRDAGPPGRGRGHRAGRAAVHLGRRGHDRGQHGRLPRLRPAPGGQRDRRHGGGRGRRDRAAARSPQIPPT